MSGISAVTAVPCVHQAVIDLALDTIQGKLNINFTNDKSITR